MYGLGEIVIACVSVFEVSKTLAPEFQKCIDG